MSQQDLSKAQERSKEYAKEWKTADDGLSTEPGNRGKKRATYHYECNAFMELSLKTLESAVSEVLLNHPQISFGDTPVWLEEDETETDTPELVQDDVEADEVELSEDKFNDHEEFDLLECPEFEPDDDLQGDDTDDAYDEVGVAEYLNDYLWRRFYDDFEDTEHTIREQAISLLAERLVPASSAAEDESKKLNEPEWFQIWFQSVTSDYGTDTAVNQRNEYQAADVPDIIFKYDGHELSYDINMGFLDQLSIPVEVIGNVNLTDGSGVPVALLRFFIAKRKAALGILAEFLMEVQKDAITSRIIPEAIRNIRSTQQKDFVTYLQTLGLDHSNEKGPITKARKSDKDKSTEGMVSRLLRGKYLLLPSSAVPIPVLTLFDRPVKNVRETSNAIEVLKKAFELHHGYPLSQSEQATIVSKVLGIKCSNRQIGSTIRDGLKQEYPKDEWKRLGLAARAGRVPDAQRLGKQGLERLCTAISEALQRES